MLEWVKKYGWLVAMFFVALPFLLNFAVTRYTPFDWRIAGEPKDWVMFWGAYISSIASLAMVYYTYCIIKQNDEIRRGRVVCNIVFYEHFYFLQLTNVGNSQTYDIEINFNEDFTNKINELSRLLFTKIEGRKFGLMPNESKYIPIECGIIGTHKTLNPKTNELEPIKITCEYINEFKKAELIVRGVYLSIGKTFKIDYSFRIDDFTNTPFALIEQSTDKQLAKISVALENINKKLK